MEESVRLIALARKYNVGVNTIVEFLNENGAGITSFSINSKIPAKYEALLEKEFFRDARIKENAAKVKLKLDKQMDMLKEASSRSSSGPMDVFPERIKKAAERDRAARQERKRERRKANRIKNQLKSRKRESGMEYKASSSAPCDYLLGWKDISFLDGSIFFLFGGRRYEISVPQARFAYNQIKKSFEERLPPILVHINGVKATLKNKTLFEDIVQLLAIRDQLFHTSTDDIKTWSPDLGKFPADLVKLFFPIPKTQYLDYLQSKQSKEHTYVPVCECQDTIDGFLFTIERSEEYLVVWESVKVDATHRASYVFSAYEQELPIVKQLLSDYIASSTANKRLSLRQKRIQEFIGFDYWYIDHDDFDSWKEKLESLSASTKNKRNGVLQKNEAEVSYSTSGQQRSYEPVHNIIQNGLKEWLERSGRFKDIVLEENNIDLKAKSIHDEAFLFEVKTSSPKKCVREALGQILEYAHYKSDEHAQKLIIVGPQPPTEDVQEYMNLLRNLYHIPVWYRQFDKDNLILVGEL